MNQCLRCSRPCPPTSLFCETCQSQLHTQLWQQEAQPVPESASKAAPVIAMSPSEGEQTGGTPERTTNPIPTIKLPETPVTPPPEPLEFSPSHNPVERIIQRMSQAAAHLSQEEQRKPIRRPSRLAPISRKIPLVGPLLSPGKADAPAPQPANAPSSTAWPWLADLDGDDNDQGVWDNATDPLLARQIPRSNPSGQIADDELQRAVAEGLATRPLPVRRRRTTTRVQVIFALVVILALVVAAIDGVLASVVLSHPHRNTGAAGGPPAVMITPNNATVGQSVTFHATGFTPNTHIFITHDVEENVELTSGSALVGLDSTGAATVSILIDDSWGPGFHSIQAEDVVTRYTASATLQITNAGPTRPSHLVIGTSKLDFGADVEGANTLQSLTLHNSGGGSISWAASSNQPWLLLAPSQGMFSASQTITVAVQRANLRPGDYNGTITFSSNVGENEWVQVHMSVRPLPANAGPVLVITPAVLSFTALDGGGSPPSQMLTINNPGTQALNWSLAGNNPVLLTSQSILLHSLNMGNSWLTTSPSSGTVAPHSSSTVQVMVNSSSLLAGVYSVMLVFDGNQGTIDTPQDVNVALTVQPHCGLQLNTGSISFTAVAGQGNPANQSLSIGATQSCAGTIAWKATSAASWLSVSPASGQVRGAQKSATAVSVNAAALKPGMYTGSISFVVAQSTETVIVQLAVQNAPPPSQPIMGAAPLNLNFSTTQGMPNPPGEIVTITNNGGGTLYWHTTVNTLTNLWLGASPSGGSIPAKSTGQVTVSVNIATLTPNTYVGQIVLNGTNANGSPASGSPQTITVNLLVLPPCVLQQPSSSSVAFSAVQGMGNPASQTINITASGNCNWPVNWSAAVSSGASWLGLSPASGVFPVSGQSATLSLNANIAGLPPNTYTAQVTISASNGTAGAIQGSPQAFTVSLTVLPPCSLSVQAPAAGLTFTTVQGQAAPPAQNFSFSEAGTCARPVSWSVAASTGNTNWLALSPSSGSDIGGGATVSASVNPQNLAPGTYTGTITISAAGSGGAPVQGSPQSITVTLIISGFTTSGTVMACSSNPCASSVPLPGATLTLTNNSTNQSVTITADSSGNYTFSNIGLGSYTLTATGSIGAQNYSGSASFSVSGNLTSFTVNAYPV